MSKKDNVNVFIVYAHISPTKKKYFGITSNKPKYRWGKDGSGYQTNQYFWRAIQKYGWDNFEHIIIAENLTYTDACALEKTLIAQNNTTNQKFGYNLSIGGELSALGCKRTEEQRKHYSESKIGLKNPCYGKPAWNSGVPCREETKEKLRQANKGHTSPTKGTHLSEEMKQHLHNINIGKIYVTHEELQITKCIEKHELDAYIQLCYHRGYSKSRANKRRKKKEVK